LNAANYDTCFVRFDKMRCTGCSSCLRVCPTKAIRIKEAKSIRLVDRCIGCGACVRICPSGAVSAATAKPPFIDPDSIAVALVSPVLYAQFPGVMPNDVLLGLRQLGFQHTIDMSYFLEMFQYATEEYIQRNRQKGMSPWPLISPVCPVVVRLIAFQFPDLLPHVLPVLRPVALMAREVRQRLIPEYEKKGQRVTLYYINPCPTQMAPHCRSEGAQGVALDVPIGINDIYPMLSKQIDALRDADSIPFAQTRFEYESCATGNASMWAISGGEIADMEVEHSLAVSGLKETIAYLQKIELGLFEDVEYIEFRTCREGCLGGVLTVTDKYLAKSAVQKMVKMFGVGRRLPRQAILRMYERGKFQTEKGAEKLLKLYGARKEALSLDAAQKIEKTLEMVEGRDCAACGAPDCRTFAEDVVRGKAGLKDCLWLRTRERKKRR
jgi:iron only hydrogenase large subunit-like protein